MPEPNWITGPLAVLFVAGLFMWLAWLILRRER
jgi:hypothetical protein